MLKYLERSEHCTDSTWNLIQFSWTFSFNDNVDFHEVHFEWKLTSCSVGSRRYRKPAGVHLICIEFPLISSAFSCYRNNYSESNQRLQQITHKTHPNKRGKSKQFRYRAHMARSFSLLLRKIRQTVAFQCLKVVNVAWISFYRMRWKVGYFSNDDFIWHFTIECRLRSTTWCELNFTVLFPTTTTASDYDWVTFAILSWVVNAFVFVLHCDVCLFKCLAHANVIWVPFAHMWHTETKDSLICADDEAKQKRRRWKMKIWLRGEKKTKICEERRNIVLLQHQLKGFWWR